MTLRAFRGHMLRGRDLAAEAEDFCIEIDLTGSFSWRNPARYFFFFFNHKADQ